jgi:hypothetical protein
MQIALHHTTVLTMTQFYALRVHFVLAMASATSHCAPPELINIKRANQFANYVLSALPAQILEW